MKFFPDTANLDELRKGASRGVVDGVTTDPTPIAKEGRPFEEHIREICQTVDGDIGAEVVSTTAPKMVEEGRELSRIHKNVVVKCPLTRDGIMATSALSKEGIQVNMTLCFTAGQALLAAKAGAYIVSPFVGRLDDIGYLVGAHIGTMPFRVLDMLFSHPLTDKGLDQFLKDWARVFQEAPAAG